MPYITPEQKIDLDPILAQFPALTMPELDYVITKLAIDQVMNRPRQFVTLNEVWGVMTGAAQEFYRRLVAPYEDVKAFENGDVYQEVVDIYLEKS